MLAHEIGRSASSRLRFEINISHGKIIGVVDDIGDAPILLDGPGRWEAALGHESDYTTLPAQAMAVGNSVGTQLAPRGREASPNASAYDAAVLQLILNSIGHIGMRRGATSDAGRSVQIRAQAQERSVRRRILPGMFSRLRPQYPDVVGSNPWFPGRVWCWPSSVLNQKSILNFLRSSGVRHSLWLGSAVVAHSTMSRL